LEDTQIQTMWYPFAISGINISAALLKLITSHNIVKPFYTNDFEIDQEKHKKITEDIFQKLYNSFFICFHEYYVEKQGNVMKFNKLLDEFLALPQLFTLLTNVKQ